MAFFSPALYRDVARNWRGTGFFYLFILLAVCWIPVSYEINAGYAAFEKSTLPELSKSVPDMQLDQGKLVVKKPMPYQITDSLTHKPIIIIDTTGKVTSLAGKPDTLMLLTDHNVMIKTDNNVTRVIDFPVGAHWAVSASSVEKWGEKAGVLLMFAFYPMALLCSWVYRVLQAIFYGAIGTLGFAELLRVHLDYKTVVRLSSVAVTPVIVIGTILGLFRVVVPHALMLYFLLAMVYLFLAIYANREQ